MLNESSRKTTVGDRAGAEDFPHGGKNCRPPRALVIDDEPLLRWSVAATLEEQGWQVTEAADVESAMAAFSEVAGAAGIVFLDPRWPDADGLQVLSDLHHLSPSTPIILMTAYGTPELVELARRLGATSALLMTGPTCAKALGVRRYRQAIRRRRSGSARRACIHARRGSENGRRTGTYRAVITSLAAGRVQVKYAADGGAVGRAPGIGYPEPSQTHRRC